MPGMEPARPTGVPRAGPAGFLLREGAARAKLPVLLAPGGGNYSAGGSHGRIVEVPFSLQQGAADAGRAYGAAKCLRLTQELP